MPNISPTYSNVAHDINYTSDEVFSTQNTPQKTEYQGRNIVMNSESAPVLLRREESSAASASYQVNDPTRRHAGIYHEVDTTPSLLPPKPTLSAQETPQVPIEVNSPMGSASASSTSDLSSTLAKQAAAIKPNDYYNQLDSQRRGEVLLAKKTLVEAPDGKLLPANCVQIDNKNMAIISEYPKANYLESYFKMLSSNRTPVLVVMASNDDIAAADKGLPAYFKQDGTYGSISTKVEGKSEKQSVGKFIYEEYQLKIKEGNKSYRIPVIHVNNWDGAKTVDNEGLKGLINHINEIKDKRIKELENGKSSALNDSNKVLPVIHGTKGYERAGFLVVATELAKSNNTLSLEKIMTDVQASTSPDIFHKKAPVKLLTQFENVKRNKRSSDSMEGAATATGEKISLDSAKLPAKLQRMLSDSEAPAATSLPPQTLSVEDREKTAKLAEGLFQRLKDEFSDSKMIAAKYIKKIENQRFGDIYTAKATVVTAPNGQPLAANRVQIGSQNVAIACQYPKRESMEDYFKMLVANRTPALVVLASEKDIGLGELPEYFRQGNEYGDVSVTVVHKGEGKLADRLDYNEHLLHVVVKGGDKVTIPVIHVSNWPDLTASGNEGLKALAGHVNEVVDKKIDAYKKKGSGTIGDKNKLLPVIHCRAGVGRTGQLLGTMELLKSESALSLESIVRDMRTTRDPKMVQILDQMRALAMLAVEQGKSVLDKKV